MSIPVTWIAFVLFLLSGATGLVYEVVWTRQLVFLLGGTTYAITTVLVAFMSGLALGSWLSGRFGDSLRRPGLGYGFLEIAVGVYGLLVPVLLGLADPLYRVLYPHVADSPWVLTAVRFLVGAIVLLLPATCMGATLPMLVRYIARANAGSGLGRSTGLLYGINTCGAVVGTLLAGFVLIPRLGLRSTTWATACVNVIIGIVAIVLLRTQRTESFDRVEAEKTALTPARSKKGKSQGAITSVGPIITKDVRQTVLAVAGFSGFAAMVYQIAWTRALIMSLGSSTYAFTCILAAFILGLGLGSLAIARWVDRWSKPVLLLALMELGIALSAIFIMPIHGRLPAIVHDLVVQKHQDYGSLLMAEFGLVMAVTFVPTFLMGAIFPLVVRLVGTSGGEAGSAVGQAYAINTLGTIIGSFLAGFVLIRGDMLGIQNSIVAAAALNAVAAGWLLTKSGVEGKLVRGHVAVGGLGLITVLLLGTTTAQWQPEVLTSGPYIYRGDTRLADRKVEFLFEDVDTTVSVERIGGEQGSLTLSVNGKADASNGPGDVRTQLLVGHLPALLDRGGKKACIIGLGSGMTLGSVARYPSYQQIDCIELSDGVIRAAGFFKDDIYDVLNTDPRVRLMRADGRNHLLLTDEKYDLIVSEPSNPWLAGISNLFTREFFQLTRDRLTPDGVFAVWLQSYSTSEANFQMVIRTLFDVYDSVSIWEAGLNDYCLIAWNGSRTIGLDEIAARFNVPAVQGDFYRISLFDVGSVLGNYVTGGDRLREWVKHAPIHTDDNALLEFRAPWDLYSRPHIRIANALLELQRSPMDVLVSTASASQPASAPAGASLADAVRGRVDRVQKARRMRVLGMQQWEYESAERGMQTQIEAYNVDPGNFLIYQILMSYSGEWDRDSRQDNRKKELLAAVEALPSPPYAPPGGATRAVMTGRIKSMLNECIEKQQWPAAAVHLSQARELTPDDPDLAKAAELIAQSAKSKS